MKTVILFSILALSSCVTTYVKETKPDGTVLETKTTTPIPGSVEAASSIATEIIKSRGNVEGTK
jgi:hypothetical protein